DKNEVAFAVLAFRKVCDFHVEKWKYGMGAAVDRKIEPAYLRVKQVFARDVLGPLQQFLAVDDLQDSEFVVAVPEIDPVTFGSCRDRPMQLKRRLPGCARLLAV